MKLEFKFSLINIVVFLVLGSLFYVLCPLPSAPVWRGTVCALAGAVLFGMCFIVVTHRSIIRRPQAKATPKQEERKK